MEFKKFPKIPRLYREVIITEKIDGTNALIAIDEDGNLHIGSRNRWLTPEKDNHGFCKWALEHADELLKLGPGYHYGEWYGSGIQRRYDLPEKHFALFNTSRWEDPAIRPACCDIVPILYRGLYYDGLIPEVLAQLSIRSHVNAFPHPEGIVVFFPNAGQLFKVTYDDNHKEVSRTDDSINPTKEKLSVA